MAPTRRDETRPGDRPPRHTAPRDLRRGHDATYRLLHQHRELFRELLVGHCGAWIDVDALDFARVERLPEGHVSEGGGRRTGDLAWRVGYPREGRHLVVVIEFQSGPDARMARRMHEYGALTALGLARAEADGGPEGMRRLREWVLERYPGPEHERLRQPRAAVGGPARGPAGGGPGAGGEHLETGGGRSGDRDLGGESAEMGGQG